jgi:hypothetical protein
MVLTVRKYEPMGPTIIANVKAKSLTITSLQAATEGVSGMFFSSGKARPT